jgi:hypothetical protein
MIKFIIDIHLPEKKSPQETKEFSIDKENYLKTLDLKEKDVFVKNNIN